MMYAYDKVYLEKARTALGRMLDYAVYDLKYNLKEFYALFLSSGVAEQFGDGDFTILVGKSGVEIAYEVLERSQIAIEKVKANYSMNRSKEYWTGWAIAYFQWETSLSFVEINEAVSICDVKAMYEPYHEMDIRQFCDKMTELYRLAKPDTNLKRIRMVAGLSQHRLAELSQVPVRTIQQYEQRQKNINKAQAETLVALSRTLCCRVVDLIEKVE